MRAENEEMEAKKKRSSTSVIKETKIRRRVYKKGTTTKTSAERTALESSTFSEIFLE
jgi:hypothetical protein